MHENPHPITGSEPTWTPAKPREDCCLDPSYEAQSVENEGDRADVEYCCTNCDNEFTEVHTIRHVERDDGERLAANQSSYGCCDEEVFSVVWRGKTGKRTAEFVGECQNCETQFSDVYKYYSNE